MMASNIDKAIKFIQSNPGSKIARVARDFDVNRNTLDSRLKRAAAPKVGQKHNRLLSDGEEKALCNYIDRLDRINLAVRTEFVVAAANQILKEGRRRLVGANPPRVGQHWVKRFFQRQGYSLHTQKQLESTRQTAEDIEVIRRYFESLQRVIEDHGITPDDLWNMDESGFRIGVGKSQLIVTKRKRAHYFGLPENRESATVIEAISAAGIAIPVFIIPSAKNHSARWYLESNNLHPDTKIFPSESGYTNDEISFSWVQHFEQMSRKTQKGAKRLLILDGHGSHHTRQFIQYCDDHDIVVFGLPPHLTHLLQPLDMVVFQPYKHYHAKALDQLVRDGITNITKLEFLSIIEEVRTNTMKEKTIKSAFAKTGIWPFNPIPVLREIDQRRPSTPTPPPSISSSNNTPTTLRQINKVTNQIQQSLQSPDVGIDPKLATKLNRLIKGSITNTAELIQDKTDLGRTKYAARIAKARRSAKNYQLQSGGVLSVHDAREMVQRKEEDEVAKAKQVIAAANERFRKAAKKVFFDAAKKARWLRLSRRLPPADIIGPDGVLRKLIRF